MVRYSRANFLVPVPQVRSLDELNARLEESCREDLKRRLRGHGQIKEALLAEELGVMQELPECFGVLRRRPWLWSGAVRAGNSSSSISTVRTGR